MREPNGHVLAVRAAIVATLQAYAHGVDRRDWELVRSCYHDDAFDDHGVYRGGPDGFVAYFAKAALAWERTSHYVFEPTIDVDGDRAVVSSAAIAHHINGPDDLVMGARYADVFESRAGDWRIVHRVVRVEWVHELAADLAHWEYAERFVPSGTPGV